MKYSVASSPGLVLLKLRGEKHPVTLIKQGFSPRNFNKTGPGDEAKYSVDWPFISMIIIITVPRGTAYRYMQKELLLYIHLLQAGGRARNTNPSVNERSS